MQILALEIGELCLAAHDALCLAEKLERKTHYVLQERRGARHIMSCKGRCARRCYRKQIIISHGIARIEKYRCRTSTEKYRCHIVYIHPLILVPKK